MEQPPPPLEKYPTLKRNKSEVGSSLLNFVFHEENSV